MSVNGALPALRGEAIVAQNMRRLNETLPPPAEFARMRLPADVLSSGGALTADRPGMTTLARVYVLYAGGTFGMAPDAATPGSPLRPLPLSRLRALLPDPVGLVPGVEVMLDGFADPIDSASATPDDWIAIARRLAKNYDAHDGFVVLHGTDTLAWTASALAFMLENLGKPVVVTGAQAPLSAPRSDARANYLRALQIAGWRATGLPAIPEVVVAFGSRLLRGCRARKVSAHARDAFASPNDAALGRFAAQSSVAADRLLPAPAKTLKLRAKLERDVLDLALHPALRPNDLRALASVGARGIVLRTYGAGNAPESPEFLAALRELAEGRLVVAISQCAEGAVRFGRYASSLALSDMGVAPGHDMTPEAALTKLMFLLGEFSPSRARRDLSRNLRGELTEAAT
jgi:L-asparaginase